MGNEAFDAGREAEAADKGTERQAAPPTPRWVKALGLIVLILVVLFIAAQLLLGVQHGPGLHGPPG